MRRPLLSRLGLALLGALAVGAALLAATPTVALAWQLTATPTITPTFPGELPTIPVQPLVPTSTPPAVTPPAGLPTLAPTNTRPSVLPTNTPPVSPTPTLALTAATAQPSPSPQASGTAGFGTRVPRTPLPSIPGRLRVQIDIESTYARALPSRDAEAVASLFEGDILEPVGRNLDGTWIEVRRINRTASIGWVPLAAIDYDFSLTDLPLTDATTGLEGPVSPAGAPLAVFVAEGVNLRPSPSYDGTTPILEIPANTVVPVFERNGAADWVRVNYLGYEGWIIAFTTRPTFDLGTLPLAPGLTEVGVALIEVIPPEIQRAQLERMRAFTLERLAVADALAVFWAQVYRGEILPCNPPAIVDEYRYSGRDVQELPEIDRYAPRLNVGVDYLNDSIAPLQNCGIVTPSVAVDGRNAAINAQVIFNATLGFLDNLEENVIPGE